MAGTSSPDVNHIESVSIIGAGNVGSHLFRLFHGAGIHVKQVYSRNPQRAQDLLCEFTDSELKPCRILTSLSALESNDACLLAVPDDAISEVAAEIEFDGLLLHVSGSVSLDALKVATDRVGVFYPLQTFRREFSLRPEGRDFPICICSANSSDLTLLEQLAMRVGHSFHHLDDAKRRQLHLAAVFVNNFANHCFALAEQHLKNEQLPFDLLLPLIRETAGRLEGNSATALQTGPARRGDTRTMQEHLAILAGDQQLSDLYCALSRSIERMYGLSH